jgi:UDPglucose--hexose-1-phosphate uridylyltransferase
MSELRHDPLEKQWVLMAPNRGLRPLDFLPPRRLIVDRKSHPCPFCVVIADPQGPQVRIAERHLDGDRVLVLANRFPALSIESPTDRSGVGPYDVMSGVGAHEVVVETEHHDIPFRALPVEQRANVLLAWRDRALDLMRDRRVQHVQIFRNEGPRAGATLEHAHSQIVATPVRPDRVKRLVANVTAHWHQRERCLLCDILAFEDEARTRASQASPHRIIAEDGPFIAWCPFASRHPFEVQIAPRRHEARYTGLTEQAALSLSRLLGKVLDALHEALAGTDFNLVLDLPPSGDSYTLAHHGLEHIDHAWHWKVNLVPRLLPYGGFELGTGVLINPTLPEDAAEHLRSLLG